MALPPGHSPDRGGAPSPHDLLDTLVALDFGNLNDARYLSFLCDVSDFWKAHVQGDYARDPGDIDQEAYHLFLGEEYLEIWGRGDVFWPPAESLSGESRPEYPRDADW